MARKPRKRQRTDLSLARLVAQALREGAPQQYYLTEQYGPDGEIEEVWEGFPIFPGETGPRVLIVTGTESAKPRTDWRERGVVPPKGFHRSRWRD